MNENQSLSGAAWQWLQRELDRWSAANRQAAFWWRDDDTVASTPELERLLALGAEHQAPISLAVIPARLEAGLEPCLARYPGISVLQHGYSHSSHARAGEKKLELADGRDADQLRYELSQGFQILQTNFGDRFLPVLVPPWNRIGPLSLKVLPDIGFRGVSTMKVRRRACPVEGLLQVNTHMDPINWRNKGCFSGHYPAIATLVQHLVARRSGYRDLDEPTGLLSHHLVQNESTWKFLAQLLAFLSQHPAVKWMDAPTIWPEPTRSQDST